jgi:hypothetical protein
VWQTVTLQFLARPGDTLCGTGLAESLARRGVRVFVEGVGADAIFLHNPFATIGHRGQPVRVGNPLIRQSDKGDCTAWQSATYDVAVRLGLDLDTLPPKLFFAEAERPLVDPPYALICPDTLPSGYTVKHYPHWRAVAEGLAGRVKLVQVGLGGDPLPGCLDLRGKTSLRQLLVLARFAALGLGEESLLNHACGASATPFVCVCSGMLHPHYIGYPTGRYLTRFGQLDCCRGGSCRKARVSALGDGSPLDAAERRCVLPVLHAAKCMADIPAEEVVAEAVRLLTTFSISDRAGGLTPT